MKELLSHSKFGSSKAFLSGSKTFFLAISFSFIRNPFSEDVCFSIMRRHTFSQEFLKAGKQSSLLKYVSNEVQPFQKHCD